ncbi:DUF6551 family protein [Nitratireductor sp. GZWM139]|uniref:DUF6551 family protein n=1 Tax=Nitratireductor sp. GZWM139 TaxID=2950541 RepID=UPI0024BEEBC0|nr:DUF6551 family protein [Nitratireductor sp. GZWM139]MDJ1463358.1 hypothetical protein [Nitratireductor sp. GZWM139]
MRKIAPLVLPDVVPAEIQGAPPELRLMSPAELHVDERYQRGLSERSLRLIRKIVSEWSWSAFKPPVVVDAGERFEVIDGQHTAIAAVTHGAIGEIPVLVIQAQEQEARAGAFVRHNRDRINVTPIQLHNALVAAGDEMALTIAQVCERAGAVILRNPPTGGRYKPGDTLAITTVRGLVNRRYARGARQVLEVCVKAGMAPISAAAIKAVECLMFAQEYKGEIDAERIALILSAHGESISTEAGRFAAERKVPLWRALASVIYMNRRKVRHAG